MFNLFKNNHWDVSISTIKSKFGISLSDLPEPSSIKEIFNIYANVYELSKESSTALLLRLFSLNYLGAAIIMKQGGEEVDARKYLFVVELMDESVNLSEKAVDHIKLERVTSKLNITIEDLLEKLGIKRG